MPVISTAPAARGQPIDPHKLRFINEVQHRVTRFIEQILIDDPARSSDEMLLRYYWRRAPRRPSKAWCIPRTRARSRRQLASTRRSAPSPARAPFRLEELLQLARRQLRGLDQFLLVVAELALRLQLLLVVHVEAADALDRVGARRPSALERVLREVEARQERLADQSISRRCP